MILILIILGLIIGSFLNAVIFRLSIDKSFVRGRSECMHCHHELQALDLIPVLSFVFLRGRCRYCGQKISWQYPLVEIATALVFALFFYTRAPLMYYAFACFFIVIGVYDFKHFLILDKVLIPAAVLGLAWSVLAGQTASSIFGALALSGFFALQYFLSKGRWIGFGDVKLGIALGLIFGLKLGVLMLILGYFIGAATGVALILSGRKSLGSKLPLGTFLSISAIIILIYGDRLASWYLGLIGF